jgi:hypothetical protein
MKRELEKLDQELEKEEAKVKYIPRRSRADISDTSARSPWAKKMILSFDGGGVKGYSSLLITKRLVSLIEEVESGIRSKSHVSSRSFKV